MLTTLLLLSVLHASPDVPLREAHEPRAFSLLSPDVLPSASPGRYAHEHKPGRPHRRGSSGSLLRPLGEFFTGFGAQLLVGTGLWTVEVITLFGATFLTAAFTGGHGAEFILGAGAHTMVLLNGAVLPLLSTLPIWLIASTDLRYSHSFWWTWLSGAATYAAFWAFQFAQPSRYGGLELVLWPTHVASWALVALAQTVVINLTKERRDFLAHAPPALLNVDGARVSLGAPLPMLAPDVRRPGHILPVFSLAQGRF
jgi:hypothetical protein